MTFTENYLAEAQRRREEHYEENYEPGEGTGFAENYLSTFTHAGQKMTPTPYGPSQLRTFREAMDRWNARQAPSIRQLEYDRLGGAERPPSIDHWMRDQLGIPHPELPRQPTLPEEQAIPSAEIGIDPERSRQAEQEWVDQQFYKAWNAVNKQIDEEIAQAVQAQQRELEKLVTPVENMEQMGELLPMLASIQAGIDIGEIEGEQAEELTDFMSAKLAMTRDYWTEEQLIRHGLDDIDIPDGPSTPWYGRIIDNPIVRYLDSLAQGGAVTVKGFLEGHSALGNVAYNWALEQMGFRSREDFLKAVEEQEPRVERAVKAMSEGLVRGVAHQHPEDMYGYDTAAADGVLDKRVNFREVLGLPPDFEPGSFVFEAMDRGMVAGAPGMARSLGWEYDPERDGFFEEFYGDIIIGGADLVGEILVDPTTWITAGASAPYRIGMKAVARVGYASKAQEVGTVVGKEAAAKAAAEAAAESRRLQRKVKMQGGIDVLPLPLQHQIIDEVRRITAPNQIGRRQITPLTVEKALRSKHRRLRYMGIPFASPLDFVMNRHAIGAKLGDTRVMRKARKAVHAGQAGDATWKGADHSDAPEWATATDKDVTPEVAGEMKRDLFGEDAARMMDRELGFEVGDTKGRSPARIRARGFRDRAVHAASRAAFETIGQIFKTATGETGSFGRAARIVRELIAPLPEEVRLAALYARIWDEGVLLATSPEARATLERLQNFDANAAAAQARVTAAWSDVERLLHESPYKTVDEALDAAWDIDPDDLDAWDLEHGRQDGPVVLDPEREMHFDEIFDEADEAVERPGGYGDDIEAEGPPEGPFEGSAPELRTGTSPAERVAELKKAVAKLEEALEQQKAVAREWLEAQIELLDHQMAKLAERAGEAAELVKHHKASVERRRRLFQQELEQFDEENFISERLGRLLDEEMELARKQSEAHDVAFGRGISNVDEKGVPVVPMGGDVVDKSSKERLAYVAGGVEPETKHTLTRNAETYEKMLEISRRQIPEDDEAMLTLAKDALEDEVAGSTDNFTDNITAAVEGVDAAKGEADKARGVLQEAQEAAEAKARVKTHRQVDDGAEVKAAQGALNRAESEVATAFASLRKTLGQNQSHAWKESIKTHRNVRAYAAARRKLHKLTEDGGLVRGLRRRVRELEESKREAAAETGRLNEEIAEKTRKLEEDRQTYRDAEKAMDAGKIPMSQPNMQKFVQAMRGLETRMGRLSKEIEELTAKRNGLRESRKTLDQQIEEAKTGIDLAFEKAMNDMGRIDQIVHENYRVLFGVLSLLTESPHWTEAESHFRELTDLARRLLGGDEPFSIPRDVGPGPHVRSGPDRFRVKTPETYPKTGAPADEVPEGAARGTSPTVDEPLSTPEIDPEPVRTDDEFVFDPESEFDRETQYAYWMQAQQDAIDFEAGVAEAQEEYRRLVETEDMDALEAEVGEELDNYLQGEEALQRRRVKFRKWVDEASDEELQIPEGDLSSGSRPHELEHNEQVRALAKARLNTQVFEPDYAERMDALKKRWPQGEKHEKLMILRMGKKQGWDQPTPPKPEAPAPTPTARVSPEPTLRSKLLRAVLDGEDFQRFVPGEIDPEDILLAIEDLRRLYGEPRLFGVRREAFQAWESATRRRAKIRKLISSEGFDVDTLRWKGVTEEAVEERRRMQGVFETEEYLADWDFRQTGIPEVAEAHGQIDTIRAAKVADLEEQAAAATRPLEMQLARMKAGPLTPEKWEEIKRAREEASRAGARQETMDTGLGGLGPLMFYGPDEVSQRAAAQAGEEVLGEAAQTVGRGLHRATDPKRVRAAKDAVSAAKKAVRDAKRQLSDAEKGIDAPTDRLSKAREALETAERYEATLREMMEEAGETIDAPAGTFSPSVREAARETRRAREAVKKAERAAKRRPAKKPPSKNRVGRLRKAVAAAEERLAAATRELEEAGTGTVVPDPAAPPAFRGEATGTMPVALPRRAAPDWLDVETFRDWEQRKAFAEYGEAPFEPVGTLRPWEAERDHRTIDLTPDQQTGAGVLVRSLVGHMPRQRIRWHETPGKPITGDFGPEVQELWEAIAPGTPIPTKLDLVTAGRKVWRDIPEEEANRLTLEFGDRMVQRESFLYWLGLEHKLREALEANPQWKVPPEEGLPGHQGAQQSLFGGEPLDIDGLSLFGRILAKIPDEFGPEHYVRFDDEIIGPPDRYAGDRPYSGSQADRRRADRESGRQAERDKAWDALRKGEEALRKAEGDVRRVRGEVDTAEINVHEAAVALKNVQERAEPVRLADPNVDDALERQARYDKDLAAAQRNLGRTRKALEARKRDLAEVEEILTEVLARQGAGEAAYSELLHKRRLLVQKDRDRRKAYRDLKEAEAAEASPAKLQKLREKLDQETTEYEQLAQEVEVAQVRATRETDEARQAATKEAGDEAAAAREAEAETPPEGDQFIEDLTANRDTKWETEVLQMGLLEWGPFTRLVDRYFRAINKVHPRAWVRRMFGDHVADALDNMRVRSRGRVHMWAEEQKAVMSKRFEETAEELVRGKWVKETPETVGEGFIELVDKWVIRFLEMGQPKARSFYQANELFEGLVFDAPLPNEALALWRRLAAGEPMEPRQVRALQEAYITGLKDMGLDSAALMMRQALEFNDQVTAMARKGGLRRGHLNQSYFPHTLTQAGKDLYADTSRNARPMIDEVRGQRDTTERAHQQRRSEGVGEMTVEQANAHLARVYSLPEGTKVFEERYLAAYAARGPSAFNAAMATEFFNGLTQMHGPADLPLAQWTPRVAYDPAVLRDLDADTLSKFTRLNGQWVELKGRMEAAGYIPVSTSAGEIWVPREIADEVSRVADLMSNPEAMGKWRQFFNNLQKVWGSSATYNVIDGIGHHSRNAVSNLVLNFIAGVVSPRPYIEALSLHRKMAQVRQRMFDEGIRYEEAAKGIMSERDLGLAQGLREYNVVDTGLHSDLTVGEDQKKIWQWLAGQKVEGVRWSLGPKRYGRAVAYAVESNARIAHFIHQVDQGLPMGMAAASVRTTLFDYSDHTKFEERIRAYAHRFYTFAARNFTLQLWGLRHAPGRTLQGWTRTQGPGKDMLLSQVSPYPWHDDDRNSIIDPLGVSNVVGGLDSPFYSFLEVLKPIWLGVEKLQGKEVTMREFMLAMRNLTSGPIPAGFDLAAQMQTEVHPFTGIKGPPGLERYLGTAFDTLAGPWWSQFDSAMRKMSGGRGVWAFGNDMTELTRDKAWGELFVLSGVLGLTIEAYSENYSQDYLGAMKRELEDAVEEHVPGGMSKLRALGLIPQEADLEDYEQELYDVMKEIREAQLEGVQDAGAVQDAYRLIEDYRDWGVYDTGTSQNDRVRVVSRREGIWKTDRQGQPVLDSRGQPVVDVGSVRAKAYYNATDPADPYLKSDGTPYTELDIPDKWDMPTREDVLEALIAEGVTLNGQLLQENAKLTDELIGHFNFRNPTTPYIEDKRLRLKFGYRPTVGVWVDRSGKEWWSDADNPENRAAGLADLETWVAQTMSPERLMNARREAASEGSYARGLEPLKLATGMSEEELRSAYERANPGRELGDLSAPVEPQSVKDRGRFPVATGGGGSIRLSDFGHQREAKIEEVLDGDTVRIRLDGEEEPRLLRLQGVDAAEKERWDQPEERRAEAAKVRLSRLLPEGSKVVLAGDGEMSDVFGRALGFVWRQGHPVSVNEQLVREGEATAEPWAVGLSQKAPLRGAEGAAMEGDLGLWSILEGVGGSGSLEDFLAGVG